MHLIQNTGPAVRKIRRFVALPEVEHLTSLRKSSIYRMVREKTFPAPLQISPRRVAWDLQSVEDWIEQRQAEAQRAAAEQAELPGAPK